MRLSPPRWAAICGGVLLFLWAPSVAVERFCAGGVVPDPHVIWCDDFEDTVPLASKYFDYDSSGGEFGLVAGQGIDGSTAVKATWRPGTVNAGHFARTFGRSPVNTLGHSAQDFTEIYWRFYVRMQEGWTGNPYKLTRATVFAAPNWAQAMVAHLWEGPGDTLALDPVSGIGAAGQLATTRYNDFDHFRWLGMAGGSTRIFAPEASGQWRCVEAHVKLNSPGVSDGVFEFWVDGALEARRDDLNWVGTWQGYGINAIFFENYWNDGAPGLRTRYFDNIVIATRRVGCLAVSPPIGPTGLVVR